MKPLPIIPHGKTVAIIQQAAPSYRIPFFQRLRTLLAEENINLKLIYGSVPGLSSQDGPLPELEWAHYIRNYRLPIGERVLLWQPCLPLLKGADLIIVEQASKLLLNYLLFLNHRRGGTPLAFWGHGRDFQTPNPDSLQEQLKAYLSRRVHWWFAYNERSAKVVQDLGYPPARITNVQNSIDTQQLLAEAKSITPEALEALRRKLGIQGQNVCIYCGRMYAAKRIPFLLQACHLLRQRIPDFEMLFIGDGPEASLVQEEANKHSWIHNLGTIEGSTRTPYFLLSKLTLMPGLIGLVVLDALTLAVPIITTDVPFHSPEIQYLDHQKNGVVVSDAESLEAYVAVIEHLLQDESKRQTLIQGCHETAPAYSIEKMASLFASGIQQAFLAPHLYRKR